MPLACASIHSRLTAQHTGSHQGTQNTEQNTEHTEIKIIGRKANTIIVV